MTGRSPGKTTAKAVSILEKDGRNWAAIPFREKSGGNGGAMRSAWIGLRYWREEDVCRLVSIARQSLYLSTNFCFFYTLLVLLQLPALMCVSIESCRLTHHHPTAYLGAYTAALFTALAIRGVSPVLWGSHLLHTLPQVREYLSRTLREVSANLKAFGAFEEAWKEYVALRGIDVKAAGPSAAPTLAAAAPGASSAAAPAASPPSASTASLTSTSTTAPATLSSASPPAPPTPLFPTPYGVVERDRFYRSLSSAGWGGASGHDSVLIAYDAVLGAGGCWEELVARAVLHGGDNDSTGTIAGVRLAFLGFCLLFSFVRLLTCVCGCVTVPRRGGGQCTV